MHDHRHHRRRLCHILLPISLSFLTIASCFPTFPFFLTLIFDACFSSFFIKHFQYANTHTFLETPQYIRLCRLSSFSIFVCIYTLIYERIYKSCTTRFFAGQLFSLTNLSPHSGLHHCLSTSEPKNAKIRSSSSSFFFFLLLLLLLFASYFTLVEHLFRTIFLKTFAIALLSFDFPKLLIYMHAHTHTLLRAIF